MTNFKRTISIFVLFALCLCASGCSAFSNLGGGDKGEQVVKDFLSAVSKNDSEKAKTYLTNPDDYESLVVIAAKLGMDGEKTKKFADQYTSIKYSVESAEKSNDGNKATVIVTMTVPDYSTAFAQGLGTVTNDMSDAQAMKNIIEKMADTKPETVKKAVAVVVVKNGDDWLIDYSNNLELLNAINGNILNSLHGNLAL